MMTSALALSQVLTAVSMHGKTADRFLRIAADKLNLSGEDREAEALLHISRAIRRVSLDISNLPFPDEQKKLLMGQISVFTPLVDFTQAHLTMEHIKGNCLSDANLVGLTFLHMTLSGHSRQPELDTTSIGLAEEFRILREDIAKSKLPVQLKSAIIARINQVSSALDHFTFFGGNDVEAVLSALTGTIFIHQKEIGRESTSLGKKILGLVQKAFVAVEAANKAVDQGQATIENGQEVYAALTNLMN